MGRLKDARGRSLEGDVERVHYLVSEVFGEAGEGRVDEVGVVGCGGYRLSRDEIKSAVR